MKEFKRTFLAIHIASRIAYEYPSRAQCMKDLAAKEQPKQDYEFWYAYSDMARKPYSSGYKAAHNRAAREYQRRKRGYGLRPRGRPKKV